MSHKSLLTSMEALGDGSWLDQIPFTDAAGDIWVEIFHRMLSLSSHL